MHITIDLAAIPDLLFPSTAGFITRLAGNTLTSSTGFTLIVF